MNLYRVRTKLKGAIKDTTPGAPLNGFPVAIVGADRASDIEAAIPEALSIELVLRGLEIIGPARELDAPPDPL